MKIVIVGSISFIEKMRQSAKLLESAGHKVVLPPSATLNQTKDYWEGVKTKKPEEFVKIGRERNIKYFKEIKSADAVLVMNLAKNGIEGYVGPNTLMELAIAFEHNKKIFLYTAPAKDFFAAEELSYLGPVVINSDVKKIK
jgi:hypothetical protein